ncbi:MAG: hypothetical protein EHM23_05675 [Acidobacteria bacterium]|nr:MAG: hypothetical protein EHM23_05675 [Acidobacteriota bacterium]
MFTTRFRLVVHFLALLVVILLLGAASPAFSQGVWEWQSPLPRVSLFGVWGSAPDDVFAVGAKGTILHYDGSSWTDMDPHTGTGFNGVWGTSSTNVLAVGTGGTVLRFDGSQWTPVSVGTSQTLFSIWGTSASDVFIAGAAGTVLHFNGTMWTAMSTGTTSDLWAIWGTSPNDVFAAGNGGTILHYNGTGWSAMASGTSELLFYLWGSSPNDVYALGTSSFRHYNGTVWADVECPTPYPVSIWGSSADSIFLAGDSGDIFHYNGTVWESIAYIDLLLMGIWGTSASDVFAVGERGVIAHYDGTFWNRVDDAEPGGLEDVWGTSGNDVFAVGTRGIYYYTGSVWIQMDSGSFRGVWGSSSTNVFAVGGAGKVSRFNGDYWSSAEYPTSHDLYDVWGSSATDVFAVGESGTILRYNGSTWTPMSSGCSEHIFAVWGSSSTDVFAAGDNGTILHYDGSGWNSMLAAPGFSFQGVWGSSSTDVFAVGDYGLILHYDGTSWSGMDAGTFEDLLAVWGTSGTNVLASGWGGTILHYDGTSWSSVENGAYDGLSGIWGSSASDIFVVGKQTILHLVFPLCSAEIQPAGAVFEPGTAVGTIHVSAQSGCEWTAESSADWLSVTSGSSGSGSGNVNFAVAANQWEERLAYIAVAGRRFYVRQLSGCTYVFNPTSSTFDTTGGTGTIEVTTLCSWTASQDSDSWEWLDIVSGSWGTGPGIVSYTVSYNYSGRPRSGRIEINGRPFYISQAFSCTYELSPQGALFRSSGGQGDITVTSGTGCAWTAQSSVPWISVTAGASGSGLGTVHYTVEPSDSPRIGTILIGGRQFSVSQTPFTWEVHNPLPEHGTLNEIWGSSNSNVLAVGYDGTILQYNGVSWTPMASGTDDDLDGIWGSSPTDVFAVGQGGTILHYDGAAWTSMNSGTDDWLEGAWGSSSSNVFAVGWNGQIVHYNGATWQSMPSGTAEDLAAVWGSSANNVFAVGESGTILHYDGTSWTSMASGTTGGLRAVWGTSASNVFAAGASPNVILHYDGSSWAVSLTTAEWESLSAVWGSSPSDVFASGYDHLFHYDGLTWTEVAEEVPELTSIWGTSATHVFGVDADSRIWLYDGAAFQSMTCGARNDLNDVWGSSATDVFAVGSEGRVLRGDGSTWNPVPSDTQEELSGVWGSSFDNVFAVGGHGIVIRWDGTAWTAMASGIHTALNDVSGSSSDNVFAVGVGGTIIHYDGTSWLPMESGTYRDLNGVWTSSSNNAFAVGREGIILHYDGSTWSSMTSGTICHLGGIWGTSPTDVFVVGDGVILHHDGTQWTRVASEWYQAVWGTGSSNVFAVSGFMGEIARFDGTAWCSMPVPTRNSLSGIWADEGGAAFAVGRGGRILHLVLPDCSASINPDASVFQPAGGAGQFHLTATSGCLWTVETSAGWIHLTSAASGSGDANVTFTVDANSGVTPRLGYITVAGRHFMLGQVGLPAPDLTLGKYHSGHDGSQLQYTIRVDNVGAAATSGTLTLTDQLPAQLAFVSASGWPCSAAGQLVTCTSGDPMGPGGHTLVTINTQRMGPVPPIVRNTAQVSCTGDADESNNHADDSRAANHSPHANAGFDHSAREHTVVSLDGSASSDDESYDELHLTYSWVQTAGTAVTISNPNAESPTFVAPLLGGAGSLQLTFQLTVDDGWSQASDSVVVTVLPHTFGDVSPSHIFYRYVEKIVAAGITAGCGPGTYCVDAPVTRAQMAVFLLKGKHGSSYVPPAQTGLFGDVPLGHWAGAWIERFAAEGITAGCGPSTYCPDGPVTRAQMAIFLLKAKYGSSYVPPEPTGVFQDVPVGHWAGRWIERLAAEGITAGCGATTYCPDAPVTRGQMAVFLSKTFGL